MVRRQSIAFEASDGPVEGLVTKFGGQPTWRETPQWPVSRTLGKPMRFICQIHMTEDLFPGCDGKMAYLFMTEDEEDVPETWEAEGGENALIVQPGGGDPPVEVRELATGPTLQRYVEVEGHDRLQPRDVEYRVRLEPGEDPAHEDEEDPDEEMSDDEFEAYQESLAGNKLGGTPGFIQDDELPDEDTHWRLLLQLDSGDVPFDVNFGDAGIGYAFVDESGSRARFLWQCF